MTYPTTARTLLGNIEHNLRGIRARVGDRLVLAAVKANAYGHGAAAVSQMIERTGAADWLGVATVEEGLQLRDAGRPVPVDGKGLQGRRPDGPVVRDRRDHDS